MVCAEGSQLILATNLVASPSDAPSFAATVLGMGSTIGLPTTVLADTGFASGRAVAALQDHGIDPLVAIGHTQSHRPYNFRPPPERKTSRRINEPWRIAMKAKMETDDARALYKRRKQTVEPVFGIIKSAIGFARFRLRGIANVTTEWTLIALAYNCRRIARLHGSGVCGHGDRAVRRPPSCSVAVKDPGSAADFPPSFSDESTGTPCPGS